MIKQFQNPFNNGSSSSDLILPLALILGTAAIIYVVKVRTDKMKDDLNNDKPRYI